MIRRNFIVAAMFAFLPFVLANRGLAQDVGDEGNFRVVVDLVQLNVAVTDSKGHYVTGLTPKDFAIFEDGTPQKLASFAEGNQQARSLGEIETGQPRAIASEISGEIAQQDTLGAMISGASVYILFDTSNYMYRGFVYAQDAIADFVRSLDNPDRVALYSYSRDLSRSTRLTPDRLHVLRGVRSTVAGDDAALYDALLLTLNDAARQPGKKVVVVFSNGPDNASKVAPEDVAELAQSRGVPVYMISTREAKAEPVSSAVFERLTAATGGKAYFAKTWQDQQRAFSSIRDDLAHLYSLSYYPQFNPNRGWRSIKVALTGEHLRKFRIRTRNGYRPQPVRVSTGLTARPVETEN
ncbi:MAG: VWA domain-containing protein [Candidatus Korobacteraceae bacterium]